MITRLSMPRMTRVPSLASTRSVSWTATGSIMSISPERSAATAVAEFWIGVKIASVIPCSASPHQPSKGCRTVCRSGWRSTSWKAPVPFAFRVAKFSASRDGRSAEFALAQPESIIIQFAIESGKSGCGEVVMISTV